MKTPKRAPGVERHQEG